MNQTRQLIMRLLWSLFLVNSLVSCIVDDVKKEFCASVYCDDEVGEAVCGAREERSGLRLRLFRSECELMKYGCSVGNDEAFGIIGMEYCNKTLNITSDLTDEINQINLLGNSILENHQQSCVEFDCSYPGDSEEVCGITQYRSDTGGGFRIRLFSNKCQLMKHNCENRQNFTITDHFICNGIELSDETVGNFSRVKLPRPVFVIDASMFNFNKNINETVDNFFSATHSFKFPLEEIQSSLNESTRRKVVEIFGPQVVYKPWIKIPKNISEDYYHKPTLSSCFHKCPTKCPNTYAPVCGVPGIVAREPSLMFQNHCFMDVAQCKMHWDNKSPTSESSSYIESSFIFCLGEVMSSMFRFLPLVRTLQHMGRMKKKSHYRYRLSNMRFLNKILPREPNLMG